MHGDNKFDIIRNMNKKKTQNINGLEFVNFDEMEQHALKNKNFKKEYDALDFEYQIVRALIKKRLNKKFSQRDLAKLTGMHQSAIARIESGNSSPTLSVVSRLLSELGAKVSIH